MARSARQNTGLGLSHREGLRAWARRHAYSFFSSLGEMVRRPIGSLMTIVVLALALTLPLALWLAVNHVSDWVGPLDRDQSLSVFLKSDMSEAAVRQLSSQLTTWPDVVAVDPIDPDSGLMEIMGHLGLSQGALETAIVEDNPLPWVLEVLPIDEVNWTELTERLSARPEVARVVVDLAWLERLDALISLAMRVVWVLSVVLVLALIFVIANAVRMEVHHRRHHIEVMALVGATPAFIRRPFLYSGFWLGVSSAVLAVGLIHVIAWTLAGPMTELSSSYSRFIQLELPSLSAALGLIGGAGVVGIMGSVLAVNQYLRRGWD